MVKPPNNTPTCPIYHPYLSYLPPQINSQKYKF